jgi:hypothetical protein
MAYAIDESGGPRDSLQAACSSSGRINNIVPGGVPRRRTLRVERVEEPTKKAGGVDDVLAEVKGSTRNTNCQPGKRRPLTDEPLHRVIAVESAAGARAGGLPRLYLISVDFVFPSLPLNVLPL